MWGFTNSILHELDKRFRTFLDMSLDTNPLNAEFFLPNVVGELISEEKATVKVLKSHDKWYGVTYREDKEKVIRAIARMKAEGLYPDKLWEK
ncbi:MAG TPA: nucleotidyltransferase, partial [Clostridiaceae bacterium]|nr:nucleotidyltransferase [Clostridiaceae bacterium]